MIDPNSFLWLESVYRGGREGGEVSLGLFYQRPVLHFVLFLYCLVWGHGQDHAVRDSKCTEKGGQCMSVVLSTHVLQAQPQPPTCTCDCTAVL